MISGKEMLTLSLSQTGLVAKGSDFVGPFFRGPRWIQGAFGYGVPLWPPFSSTGASASPPVSNLLIKVNMLSSKFKPRCHIPRGTSDWDFWYWAFFKRTGSEAVIFFINCLITAA
jgi:hypothetical protein